jgi:dethiobiotin synthetase
MRGLFISGTGTGVGKTVVAAALMHRFRNIAPLCYWKPIQTGIEETDDTATVRILGNCADREILDAGIRMRGSLSPHIAARLAGEEIDLERLTQMTSTARDTSRWFVEGAGGVLVPINSRQMMLDLMEKLGLPVLIVARSTLGTINHTLMTLETLHRRSQRIAGVVMVGDPDKENRDAIEHFGEVAVLGELPHFPSLAPENLAAWARTWLDPNGALLEYLQ